jgi:X-Pro dipeptidyl-peptidase
MFLAAAAAGLSLVAVHGAGATGPPTIVVTDGETAPVFSYSSAIRERVWVRVAGVDQDGDGVDDRTAIDIMRPAETESGLQVPAIIVPSPYFTSVGKGNETEFLHTSGGVADQFPLFYDNFFVPRGYAVILAEANGTGFSTGCPLHGGPGDIASMKAVVDWLQGRAQGFDARSNGNAVLADWDNGKAAMIGKSYDGTIANGVAATGVQGLTTIVPESAISSWYDYSRMGGIRETNNYPASLSGSITQDKAATSLGETPPTGAASRFTVCAGTRTTLNGLDGDETGDLNDFWNARNYNLNVGNVTASVFAVHGLNDDNVRLNQLTNWWAGLAAHNVPRKLWLSQEGHVDPFDFDRAQWVDTLHRWFDFWLQGVPNGIMNEPRVHIETPTGTFVDEADWPAPGTANAPLFLNGTVAGSGGRFGAAANSGSTATLSFDDAPNQTESAMIGTPTGSQANRLAFLSAPLQSSLRISGSPTIDLHASLSTAGGNLGAILVDYSATSFQRIGRLGSDGISNSQTRTCWGGSSVLEDACYLEVTKPVSTVFNWRVAKGILDTQNRDSLSAAAALVPNQSYDFSFPLIPNDYTFLAGHQIGVIIVSSYKSFSSVNDPSAPHVTVDTHQSKILLPVVGGSAALQAAGVFAYDTVAPQLSVAPVLVEATGPTTPVTYSATATDNADASPVVSCTPASGSGFPVGPTTVQCSAHDASGNASTGSFVVTVTDTTAPSLVAPVLGVREATSAAGAVVTYAAGASDLADPSPSASCLPASGSTFSIGLTTVNCAVHDASGNSATGTFDVTVADTTGPVLHLPAPITVEANAATGSAVPYVAGATDLVDPAPTVSCSPASGATFAVGLTTVHCTGEDVRHNQTNGTFAVNVVDATAPALLAAPVTAEATSAAGAAVVYSATAVDLVDPAATASCTPASGSTFVIGTTTVHCDTRDASANTGGGSLTVTVRDTTGPTLHLPAPISVDATVTPTVTVSYAATASDIVDPAPAVACLPASGSAFGIGTTHVTCTGADATGNTTTGSFLVTVNDKLPLPPAPVVVVDSDPAVLHLPASIQASATSRLGVAVSYAATATDALDPAPVLACLPASGSTFALGTTTVQCTATDRAGNISRGSFTVLVADTTPPVLDVPGRLDVDASSPRGATVRYRVTATDAIDPTPSVSCRPASGSEFAIGRTTVRCTARDDAGNAATSSFVVDVASPAVQLRDLRKALPKKLVPRLNAILAAAASRRHVQACAALAELTRATSSAKTRAELARIGRALGC